MKNSTKSIEYWYHIVRSTWRLWDSLQILTKIYYPYQFRNLYNITCIKNCTLIYIFVYLVSTLIYNQYRDVSKSYFPQNLIIIISKISIGSFFARKFYRELIKGITLRMKYFQNRTLLTNHNASYFYCQTYADFCLFSIF